MTALLIARRDRVEVGRLVLSKNEVVIGRSSKADLPLEDEDVSRRHAVVTAGDDGHTLSDPGSRNGIALNGELIRALQRLKDGDEITVGPFTLTYHASEPASAGAEVGDDEAATRFISQKDLKKTLPGKPVEAASSTDPIQVKVALLEGPLKDAVYENWSGDLTIGRGLDNHVVLVDDAVSIYHARVFRKDDDFYLEDLGSSNGTFLRGVRCTSQKLRNGDKIRIGTTTIAFTKINRVTQKKMRRLAMISSAVIVFIALLAVALTPDDAAELAAQKGHTYFNEKQYEQARQAFEEALKHDADNEAARSGMTLLKRRSDRLTTIAEATTAMEEGRYDRAMELCDIVIKSYSAAESRSARSLKEAVRVFQEAIIAYDAANWPDAVRILKELTVDYPNIQTIKQRLAVAEAENAALQALQKARDAARRLQTEIAQNFLRAVPATSRYHTEARELEASLDWLKNLNDLLNSDRVPDLLAASAALGSEAHPLKAAGIDPVTLKERVDQRLVTVANELAANGAARFQADDRRQAYAFYRDAQVADPQNAAAKEGLVQLRNAIRVECTKLIQDARRQESLGQKKAAAAIYENVMRRSIEGDEYYNLAKRKVTELSN